MTFFDWFMAVLGMVCLVTIIFLVTCKVKPSVLKTEKVKVIYDFMVGNDVYETE